MLILQPARSDVKIGQARTHGNRLVDAWWEGLLKDFLEIQNSRSANKKISII